MRAFGVPCDRRVSGEVRLPSSKSVTNRVLNLALLGRRGLVVERPLAAADTRAFAAALETLGFERSDAEGGWRLTPTAPPGGGRIDCGASGTMARFMTASLASMPGSWNLDGEARLRERPLGALIGALRGLGARIDCRAAEGFLPLTIEGRELRGGAIAIDAGESSQFLSALLMVATRVAEPLEIRAAAVTSAPYVDVTLQVLERFGARIESAGAGIFVVEPGLDPPARFAVEGDLSAAAYFAAAAALTRGRVVLRGGRVDSRQGDRRFLDLLRQMGAAIEWRDPDRVTVSGGERLVGLDVDMADLPDQVPTLAAIAPFAAGTTHIRNVAHLRIKESDRLAACAAELERLGVAAEELPDGLTIPGVWARSRPPATPVRVATYDDHRIAMSFALTGLRRPGVEIADPGVVAKSYPGFWEDFERCLGE